MWYSVRIHTPIYTKLAVDLHYYPSCFLSYQLPSVFPDKNRQKLVIGHVIFLWLCQKLLTWTASVYSVSLLVLWLAKFIHPHVSEWLLRWIRKHMLLISAPLAVIMIRPAKKPQDDTRDRMLESGWCSFPASPHLQISACDFSRHIEHKIWTIRTFRRVWKPAMVSPLLLSLALFASSVNAATPTVTLDNGVFTGTTDGISSKFLGIPFAIPPWVSSYSWT